MERDLSGVFSHPLSPPPYSSLHLTSHQVYERGTNVEQFVTRFLLKESANQIHSLLNSVESAVDAIDEQHCSQSGYPTKVSQRVPEKRYENPVTDYPPNNRVSAVKDAAPRNINTATVWFDLHQRLTDTDGTASA
ncbi:unnamed protein product, partial [Coregonus sp. 'balchen']